MQVIKSLQNFGMDKFQTNININQVIQMKVLFLEEPETMKKNTMNMDNIKVK